MTDQPERLSTDELPPGCPAWAGALFGELALESDLTSYPVVEVLGLLEATRESLTVGAMSGWGEIDGAPEWLSMVVQAHRDADSRFGAAHVVAEIEVVENILDDLRVELLRLHCGGAVEDVGRVEDVWGGRSSRRSSRTAIETAMTRMTSRRQRQRQREARKGRRP